MLQQKYMRSASHASVMNLWSLNKLYLTGLTPLASAAVLLWNKALIFMQLLVIKLHVMKQPCQVPELWVAQRVRM